MDGNYLCADIGATNARFARVSTTDGQFRILARQDFSSPAFAEVSALVAAALTALPGEYAGIALALPGPVIDQCCRVTLLPWRICATEIEAALAIPTRLLNDLEAQGWGLDLLGAEERVSLTPARAGRPGNRCILAPGSDLGEAILYWDGRLHRPFATEGGHADFAPDNDFEYRLAQLLREQYGHARWGDLLSGRGIVSLYRLLSNNSDCCQTGEVVSQRALEGDPQARAAIEAFLSILGREAGNLALKAMAVDGVYLAGGILPGLPRDWVREQVCAGFSAKPSMAHLLDRIPLYIATSPSLGLLGAARFLTLNSER